jgi:hypothetical protein
MSKTLYKVSFLSNGKIYELHARHVAASDIWGFTAISDLVFGGDGESLVIDPIEERLRDEFANTRVLHLPIHAIVRIEEVRQRGQLAIRDAASGEKVTPFPLPPPKAR